MRHLFIGACAVVTLSCTAVPAVAAVPETAPAASGLQGDLGLSGKANHRRPVPRETQIVRWILRNHGTDRLERVRLDARVPADWKVVRAPGCAAAGEGRLRCDLGTLGAKATRRVRIEMTLPRRPKLGPVRLRAATRFEAAGDSYLGPSAGMRLTVVRHR